MLNGNKTLAAGLIDVGQGGGNSTRNTSMVGNVTVYDIDLMSGTVLLFGS
jgi:hypothetical protein